MFDFISQNIGTIIVFLAVAAIVASIMIGMIRNKKKGKSSCGGSCGGCALSDKCHPRQEDKK